jgi:hypothetical protein
MYHGTGGRLADVCHTCEEQMSELSQHPLPRPLEDTTRPTKSAAFFLIVGGILIAASLFLPWLHLSTSFGDGPHEFDFDPWTAIHFNAGNSVVTLVLVLLLAGWGIVIGSVILALSRSMRLRRALTIIVIALACLYGGGMLLTVGVVSVGFSLSWPYYNVTTQYGGCRRCTRVLECSGRRFEGVEHSTHIADGSYCILSTGGLFAHPPSKLPSLRDTEDVGVTDQRSACRTHLFAPLLRRQQWAQTGLRVQESFS